MLPGLTGDDLVSRGVVDLVGLRQIQIHFVSALEGIAIILIVEQFAHFTDVLFSQFGLSVSLAAGVHPINSLSGFMLPKLGA